MDLELLSITPKSLSTVFGGIGSIEPKSGSVIFYTIGNTTGVGKDIRKKVRGSISISKPTNW